MLLFTGEVLPIGKGRIIRKPGGINGEANGNTRGKEKKDRVAILSFGTRLSEALIAANEVEEKEIGRAHV